MGYCLWGRIELDITEVTAAVAAAAYISIIILNVNGLNAPTKRHRLAEWIQKQDPRICCLIRNSLETSRHIQTESERMEIYIPCK